MELNELEPNQIQMLDGLRAAIQSQRIRHPSILDIGCGSGHLHHRLLLDGAGAVVGVEFSDHDLSTAETLAQELGHADRVMYIKGDFTVVASQLALADVTVLDKVLHCYQDPQRFIRLSAGHTKTLYAVTYLRDTRRMRWIIRGSGAMMKLLRMPWFPCFTSPEDIRDWVRSEGFQRISHDQTDMWHTEIYLRRVPVGNAGRGAC